MSTGLATPDCEGSAEITSADIRRRPTQCMLPLKDLDRAILASIRVRAAIRVLGKEVGYKVLADLWGCTDAKVSQKIEESDRNYVKPHELLAAMAIDVRGGVLAAICNELGYETPERKADPTSDADRLLIAAGDLFGPDILELLRRKAGV